MKILYCILSLLMTFQYILPNTNPNEELLHAGEHGTEDRIYKLLKIDGANINTTDKQGRTPLMIASGHQLPSIVNTLVVHKPKLDIQDDEGNTALIHAVLRGEHLTERQRHIIEVLLNHGANPAIKNKKNQSLLDFINKKQKNEFTEGTIEAIRRSMQQAS